MTRRWYVSLGRVGPFRLYLVNGRVRASVGLTRRGRR